MDRKTQDRYAAGNVLCAPPSCLCNENIITVAYMDYNCRRPLHVVHRNPCCTSKLRHDRNHCKKVHPAPQPPLQTPKLLLLLCIQRLVHYNTMYNAHGPPKHQLLTKFKPTQLLLSSSCATKTLHQLNPKNRANQTRRPLYTWYTSF